MLTQLKEVLRMLFRRLRGNHEDHHHLRLSRVSILHRFLLQKISSRRARILSGCTEGKQRKGSHPRLVPTTDGKTRGINEKTAKTFRANTKKTKSLIDAMCILLVMNDKGKRRGCLLGGYAIHKYQNYQMSEAVMVGGLVYDNKVFDLKRRL